MGSGSSHASHANKKGASASSQSVRQACRRKDCVFLEHTRQKHGFCCGGCAKYNKHGPLCQKAQAMASDQAQEEVQMQQDAQLRAIDWQASLRFGPNAYGTEEKRLTGTETMHLEVHQGHLFASFGKWMSSDFVNKNFEKMNNSIARLDHAKGKWVVDMQGQHSSRYATRISCLKSIRWTRDYNGQVLDPPVNQLVAMYGLGQHGNFMLFRDDQDTNAPGNQHVWRESKYTDGKNFKGQSTARATVIHLDSVTGVERIFAIEGYMGAISGVFDPRSTNPGHVVWDEHPEKLDLSRVGNPPQLELRPLSLVSANGKLYMSSGGLILVRKDGPSPIWEVVLDITKSRVADGKLIDAVGGIRGMTAVPDPNGQGSSILFTWNPNGQSKSWILRADVGKESGQATAVAEEESSIVKLAKQYLGIDDFHYSIGAYNDMCPVTFASQTCNLVGFEVYAGKRAAAIVPVDKGQQRGSGGFWAGGGFAVRRGPGEYQVLEVGGRRSSPEQTQPILTAVRTYVQSPFAEEPDTVYFGGYDCNNFPSDHTAWVYKCRLTKVSK